MLKSNILLSAVSMLMARAAIPTLGMSGDVRTGNQKKKVPHYPLGTFIDGQKPHNSKASHRKAIAHHRKLANINKTPAKMEGSEKGFYQGKISDCLISRVPYQGMKKNPDSRPAVKRIGYRMVPSYVSDEAVAAANRVD